MDPEIRKVLLGVLTFLGGLGFIIYSYYIWYNYKIDNNKVYVFAKVIHVGGGELPDFEFEYKYKGKRYTGYLTTLDVKKENSYFVLEISSVSPSLWRINDNIVIDKKHTLINLDSSWVE